MRSMEKRPVESPEVNLRIPDAWSNPAEFFDRLPRGSRCTANSLLLADGTAFEINPLACRRGFPAHLRRFVPEAADRARTGAGGKLPREYLPDPTRREHRRGPASHGGRGGRAGGAGVFVDNSGIAHGATDWLTLFDDAANGGAYWAFVTVVRTEDELYSLGMHVLGFRDAIIPSTGN
jgi:hypothetical protein